MNRSCFTVPGAPQHRAFTVLCSGDSREHKGTSTVTHAVDRVQRAHPEITLETYHGQGIAQADMAARYAGADLFVDAQWHAGWNNPVIEAMACATPVVCSDIGGVMDFAFNEKTALVVPARDVDAFASAIARMIESPGLRASLAANALREVERFDWDAAVERFLDLLYKKSGGAPARDHGMKRNLLLAVFALLFALGSTEVVLRTTHASGRGCRGPNLTRRSAGDRPTRVLVLQGK